MKNSIDKKIFEAVFDEKVKKPPKFNYVELELGVSKSSVKLSKVQKSVLLQMRIGGELVKNRTYAYIYGATVRTNTFLVLKNNGLIKPSSRFYQGIGQKYKLTELGKTIKL